MISTRFLHDFAAAVLLGGLTALAPACGDDDDQAADTSTVDAPASTSQDTGEAATTGSSSAPDTTGDGGTTDGGLTTGTGAETSTDGDTTGGDTFEIPAWPTPKVTLPAACGVAGPQYCNPLEGTGCDARETCDLAYDGTLQCVAEGAGGGAAEGAPCDGVSGPFCARGLTCLGTRATTGQATCARFCCEDADCDTGTCQPLHARGPSAGNVGACATAAPGQAIIGAQPGLIEGRGYIPFWTSPREALASEMRWYATACPDIGGYPLQAMATHYGGDCQVDTTDEVLVALQGGTGVLTQLAWDAFSGGTDATAIPIAKGIADYMIEQGVTPNEGTWPNVIRSTGIPLAMPQPPDCGRNADPAYFIEPDKLGVAGYSLVKLAARTGERKYLDAGLHHARMLARNMVEADTTRSPWPFRIDWRDGSMSTFIPEPISGNMVYILRLFDELIAAGYGEFATPREKLWAWIRDLQIPSAGTGGHLWVEFFEDRFLQTNRTAWAPLAMASYLLEKREALDPDWYAHADLLLTFVENTFVDVINGFPLCIEQDTGRKPYGGILSTYAAAEAQWAALTGDTDRRARAYLATTMMVQIIGNDGCPSDRAFGGGCGGWQEDAHTDRVHNLVTVFRAFPEWAD